ncbi:hypothetical protein Tco_0185433 [Tanacetum coccineum]
MVVYIGSGGEDIWGSGDDHGESGDGCGVGGGQSRRSWVTPPSSPISSSSKSSSSMTHHHFIHRPLRRRIICWVSLGSSSSSSGSEFAMYPGESVVGETAAGSGCSSAGNISSYGGINFGYTG